MNERSFIFANEIPRRFVISAKKKKNGKYNRILEAAVKVFAEQGFFQSTVSKIAREAGVADGTIYLYFDNKEDILTQFYSYKTKQVFERFHKVVDEAETSGDKLKSLIRYHLEVFQEDYNMAVVYQAGTRRNSIKVEAQIKEMSKLYLDIVGDIVEQGQQEGGMRRDLYLGLAKRFIMGAVNDVINNWVLAGGKYDMVSMADPLVDLIIRGIGATGKASDLK